MNRSCRTVPTQLTSLQITIVLMSAPNGSTWRLAPGEGRLQSVRESAILPAPCRIGSFEVMFWLRSWARADCSFGTAPTDMASGKSAPSTAAKSANLGTAAIGLSGVAGVA
jgi:hypothetical protein